MARPADRVRREVLTLVLLVIGLDAAFVGGYYLAGLRDAATPVKLGYTVLWTAATLVVLVRGLGRVRRARGP